MRPFALLFLHPEYLQTDYLKPLEPRTCRALDEISFALPVPIGSVLRLTATVTKSSTETNQVHSQVEAEVVNVSTGKREKTNVRPPSSLLSAALDTSIEGLTWLVGRSITLQDFHFTWLKDDGLPLTREVVPEVRRSLPTTPSSSP